MKVALYKTMKIHSSMIKKAKFNLEMSYRDMAEQDLIVSIGSSQVIRWIQELNGTSNMDNEINRIKRAIKRIRGQKVTPERKKRMKDLYDQLFTIQFEKDYMSVVMDKPGDYQLINQGFTINGIKYRRFLGTNGGIKNSTIVYINELLYPELKKRLDNGRNLNKELVPAKLEAYQALVCSASTPLPEPKGIIVVHDCITHFTEDVIQISDGENDEEPKLEFIGKSAIERNNSDGCGLMTPSYSARVGLMINGNEKPISGMNTRYSWEKGMVYTFDFVEFAEKVAGTYKIIDVWGDERDVRDADVILTESMLKLWDSYSSWEEYKANCDLNHYEFCAPKMTPDELENQHTTNYQFLQSYELTDEEIKELCKPTIEEIRDIYGADYRKTILYLAGQGVNLENVERLDNDVAKALLIEPGLISDPYVVSRVNYMIKRKMDSAKIGTLSVAANYSLISGDLFALAQSAFNLPVTGLLQAGEIYHRYWLDKGAESVVCFRAPMTNAHNIKKVTLNKSEEAAYWFRFIPTAAVFNAWDTLCDALNGCDFDGDTTFITDNPILLNNTNKLPTIMCMQRKAAKIVPTEDDLIQANLLAFSDLIGQITNRVTSMFEVQARYSPDSPEYKELEYRILCGQHYQQAQIDAAKGIIAKPMPEYWFRISKKNLPGLTDLQKKICANIKPYFMRYRYEAEGTKYNKYVKNNMFNISRLFQPKYGTKTIEDLEKYEPKTQEINEYIENYYRFLPLGVGPCTINRICWYLEDEFGDIKSKTPKNGDFDTSILKCGVKHTPQQERAIQEIYKEYLDKTTEFMRLANTYGITKDDIELEKEYLKDEFIAKCDMAIPDVEVQTDTIIDVVYKSNHSKRFVWEICGEQIIKNLLEKKNYTYNIPVKDPEGDIEFNGNKFKMIQKEVFTNENIDSE